VIPEGTEETFERSALTIFVRVQALPALPAFAGLGSFRAFTWRIRRQASFAQRGGLASLPNRDGDAKNLAVEDLAPVRLARVTELAGILVADK
jgi:hypothetical protein